MTRDVPATCDVQTPCGVPPQREAPTLCEGPTPSSATPRGTAVAGATVAMLLLAGRAGGGATSGTPVIVALTYSGIRYDCDRLSDIAPMLAPADPDAVDSAPDRRALTKAVGQAAGQAAEARQTVEETETHVDDVAARNPEFDGHTLGVLVNRGQEYGIELVNLASSPSEGLLTDLGFDPHPNAASADDVLSVRWTADTLETTLDGTFDE